jgi:hypothetical protein
MTIHTVATRTTAKAAPAPINNGFFDVAPGDVAGFLTGVGASVFFFSFFSGLSLGDGFLPTS